MVLWRVDNLKIGFELLENILPKHRNTTIGNSEKEIIKKENDLGVKIPRILRNYYAKYGKCKYITQNCNNQYEPILLKYIFIPDKNFFTNNKDYLVFHQCKESVIYCGIKFSDLYLDDPPVYLCTWDNSDWQLDNYSLSNFLVCKALVQIATEVRFPYWANFGESIWTLSNYIELWNIDAEKHEIKETSYFQAWKIYIKDDVLVVLESVLDDNEEYILWVSLASFYRRNIQQMLLNKQHKYKLPTYGTNCFKKKNSNLLRFIEILNKPPPLSLPE